MSEPTQKDAAEIRGATRNTVRQWADRRRGPTEPADRDVCGWQRCADAMLNAAIRDLGAGTDAAAPFRAALVALRARP
jgi:hypothetical protein